MGRREEIRKKCRRAENADRHLIMERSSINFYVSFHGLGIMEVGALCFPQAAVMGH
jgi:hypothetical protein